jgi:hypothetical protein
MYRILIRLMAEGLSLKQTEKSKHVLFSGMIMLFHTILLGTVFKVMNIFSRYSVLVTASTVVTALSDQLLPIGTAGTPPSPTVHLLPSVQCKYHYCWYTAFPNSAPVALSTV